jgi:PAS domain S-box-containing protein
VLYSQDAALHQKIRGLLLDVAAVHTVDDPARVENTLQQYDPTLLILDLRADDWRSLCLRTREEFPRSLVLALGVAGSEPVRDVESMGTFAIEDYCIGRARLQAIVRRGNDHLRLIQENQVLRRDAARAAAERLDQGSVAASSGAMPLPLQHFTQAFRKFSDVNAMLESMVEGIVGWSRVSRAGVFSVSRGQRTYRLRAGVRCLDSLREMEIQPMDPLVRWMHMNAHVVSRSTLAHEEDPGERIMLEHSLDALGAEVIVPLHGRNDIIGWMFVGRHVTGRPFSAQDLENLMLLSEHVSNTLENALLYEEVALQKTLAETLIHSLPAGIVAADSDGIVRWFNSTAQDILGIPAETVLNKPLKGNLEGPLAGLLTACLRGDRQDEPVEWVTPRTRRFLSIAVRRLEADDQCLGGVLIVRDMTREKQDELERASFWTELSSAMSHEIRNPLVAISTFAQLLPERYSDGEFREQFRDLVTREIARLNAMMDQINAFANPRKLEFKPVSMASVLRQAVRAARQRFEKPCETVITCDENLPAVRADEKDLTECFCHLITNAMEAVKNTASPSIHLTVVTDRGQDGKARGCAVHVQDNGSGIPPHIRDKIFSPFCTTKARGIGLGFPLVKRTVTDHGGEISVSTGANGTTITVTLPTSVASHYVEQAANIGRR